MSLGFEHPWVLWALPLGLLPLLAVGRTPLACPAEGVLPRDRASDLLELALRAAAAVAIVALLAALAGPYHPGERVERIGRGAQMVLLLDRSRSMDQPFYSGAGRPFTALTGSQMQRSKAGVARRLVSQFVASRQDDMFGMVLFSTYPIEVLPLTRKQDAVQAAIAAGGLGRGLAETDLGAGLEAALGFFDERRFVGSRIVMLISDGAAKLDFATQASIRNLVSRNRVTLYWIYIRSHNSPGIFTELGEVRDETAPQRELHRFFSSLEVPYRAYTAESPDALERAIADVSRLQTLPIRYQRQLPKRSLMQAFIGAALGLVALLFLAALMELRAWR